MITAESKTENVIAAKKAGVNNYIVKPFNAATLKTKMEAVFPGRRRLHAPNRLAGRSRSPSTRTASTIRQRCSRRTLTVLLRLAIFTSG